MSVAEKLQRKEMRQTSSRQVRLKLVYLDVWSLVKLSFLVWLHQFFSMGWGAMLNSFFVFTSMIM